MLCYSQNSMMCVIALTFFALFSLPSPSFDAYDFTTLSLFLYPQRPFIHFFSFIFPFHTSQEQDEMAHGLDSTICYWYMRIGIAIVGNPSPTQSTRTTLLTRTQGPRHLRTPTTGLAMGQDPRNQEGDPPPRPTREPTSRESNRPPARNRSIDSR